MQAQDYSLEQLNGLVSLTEQLTKNPETREEFLRLAKKILPDTPIPEIDAKDQISKVLNEEREHRKKLEEKIQEREIMDKIEKERSFIKSKYSLSDDDVASVEKLMVEKSIPNFQTGAEFFTMSRKTAESTASPVFNSRKMELPSGDVWGKGMFNNGALRDIALDEAQKAFNEIRGS